MQQQLQTFQQRIHQVLATLLKAQTNTPPRLAQAIEYATLNPAKRIRPAIVYAIAEALDLPLTHLDIPAAALELIHSYSLVHDDLPAMDDDALRRGQPTCHIQFDEATAILTGDAQLTLAFDCLSNAPHLSDGIIIKMIQCLAQAAGQNGMIGGQMIDIQSVGQFNNQAKLEQMHLLKTGALIQAAFHLGAMPSPRYPELAPLLSELGKAIGLAFQVQDDILDIEGTTEELGKPQGSDQASNKSTYPQLMGLDGAKILLKQLIEQAHSLKKQSGLDSVFLTQLIDYIATRKS